MPRHSRALLALRNYRNIRPQLYRTGWLTPRRLSTSARPSENCGQCGPDKSQWVKLAGLAGGLSYGCYSYYNFQDAVIKSSLYDVSPYKLMLYRTMPLGFITSIAGTLASVHVPECLRNFLYGAYAWCYSCNLDECAPLVEYTTFNKFFTRPLIDGLRPVSQSLLTSPADGKIFAAGRLDPACDLFPEQIKGVRYPLRIFLGDKINADLRKSSKALYYCSVYLAPGSYHRFHSPVEGFEIECVQRVSGEVLPVAPWMMRLAPGLVCMNERAIIEGKWNHGRFFMVPVGATNVGTITLKDPLSNRRAGALTDSTILHVAAKAEEIGQFEMGSLVVLVFEGPDNFEWNSHTESWIKYGEPLGSLV